MLGSLQFSVAWEHWVFHLTPVQFSKIHVQTHTQWSASPTQEIASHGCSSSTVVARHTLGSCSGSRPLHPSHSFVDPREPSGSLESSDLLVLLPWSQLKMFGVSFSQLPTDSQSLARADLHVSRSTHDFPSGHSICQIFRRRLECPTHPT